ncbi:hypothetical protein R1sor_007435 [Riccia sorocarpa]|uniref:Uncharacterized protein n=1 Tax=Riccia sorocarpa TaxID=122646 RepID=A0ABD3HWS0_9MARC
MSSALLVYYIVRLTDIYHREVLHIVCASLSYRRCRGHSFAKRTILRVGHQFCYSPSAFADSLSPVVGCLLSEFRVEPRSVLAALVSSELIPISLSKLFLSSTPVVSQLQSESTSAAGSADNNSSNNNHYSSTTSWDSLLSPAVPQAAPLSALASEFRQSGLIAHLPNTPSTIGIGSNSASSILTWRIPRQEAFFVGSQAEGGGREAGAAVAPAVAGGGGVSGGAGRVDSAPDWTVSSPLSDRPLKERDLSLGFGTTSAHRSQEGNGLWSRNTGGGGGGYGFVGSAEGAGPGGIPGGLAGTTPRDIFREIVGRGGGEDFGVGTSPYHGAVGGGVRRDDSSRQAAAAAEEGRGGSFVAYVGGEGRVTHHVAAPNRAEESGSGSTGPAVPKRKGPDEEPVEGGIWGNNTVLRESAEAAYKRRRLDQVSSSMRAMDHVQSLGDVRPSSDARAALENKEDEHTLQLREAQRAKVAAPQPPQPAAAAAAVAAGVGSAQGGTACLECGNQAKKDCLHQRCRTCCKSRGLNCPTHIKSTWVPAAKRRERQAAEAAAAAAGQPRPKSKRARSLALSAPANPTTSHTNTSAGTSPRGSDINSGQAVKGPLPPEVRTQAVFKFVRLSGVDDGDQEFAYQATVKIGGHIFKGVLHDQGPDNGSTSAPPSVPDLQLGARSMPTSSALIDPTGLYGNPNTGLLGGENLSSFGGLSNLWWQNRQQG